jgi:hypothetical protein
MINILLNFPVKGQSNQNFFTFNFFTGGFLPSPLLGVPDRRIRDLEVVVVRRTINLGTGNLE